MNKNTSKNIAQALLEQYDKNSGVWTDPEELSLIPAKSIATPLTEKGRWIVDIDYFGYKNTGYRFNLEPIFKNYRVAKFFALLDEGFERKIFHFYEIFVERNGGIYGLFQEEYEEWCLQKGLQAKIDYFDMVDFLITGRWLETEITHDGKEVQLPIIDGVEYGEWFAFTIDEIKKVLRKYSTLSLKEIEPNRFYVTYGKVQGKKAFELFKKEIITFTPQRFEGEEVKWFSDFKPVPNEERLIYTLHSNGFCYVYDLEDLTVFEIVKSKFEEKHIRGELLLTAENFYQGGGNKHNIGVFNVNGRIVVREDVERDNKVPHYKHVAKKVDVIADIRDIGGAFLRHPDCYIDKYSSYVFIVSKGKDIGHGFVRLTSKKIEVAEIYLNKHGGVDVSYRGTIADCGYYTYNNWGDGDIVMHDDFAKKLKKGGKK